jgi:hypothetical protein
MTSEFIATFGATLTVVLAFLTPTAAAIVTYFLSRRKIQEIHVIVNNQRTEMKKRIEALEHSLGIEPDADPPSPSD